MTDCNEKIKRYCHALKRKELSARGASENEINAAISELEQTYREIMANPQEIKKFFKGHSYKRWASYFSHPPMESLLRSHAKLFIAHGTLDNSIPIESADLLSTELIRMKRADVIMRRLPGYDHGLGEAGKPKSGPTMEPIFSEALTWFKNCTQQ